MFTLGHLLFRCGSALAEDAWGLPSIDVIQPNLLMSNQPQLQSITNTHPVHAYQNGLTNASHRNSFIVFDTPPRAILTHGL